MFLMMCASSLQVAIEISETIAETDRDVTSQILSESTSRSDGSVYMYNIWMDFEICRITIL